MSIKPALVVDYYSDVLCVWAWIAQKRIEELQQQFGKRVEFRYCYIDIFGDARTKISQNLEADEGRQKFHAHVLDVAKPYADAVINPAIWGAVCPTTSANAHLLCKAVLLVAGEQAAANFTLLLRQSFFVHAKDISQSNVLLSLLESAGQPVAAIKELIRSGAAMAALMSDYHHARDQAIKGSPSYVLDGGRQILYGNVGYRVLHANIEELLVSPPDEASWC